MRAIPRPLYRWRFNDFVTFNGTRLKFRALDSKWVCMAVHNLSISTQRFTADPKSLPAWDRRPKSEPTVRA